MNSVSGAAGVLTGAWASRPSSPSTWQMYYATDVGENGSLWIYNGTRWRLTAGISNLKTRTSAGSARGNSEVIDLQASIPAGAWQVGDAIKVSSPYTKSAGATDQGRLTVRVGTAGTTGDTAITGLSAFVICATNVLAAGFEREIILLSNTSALAAQSNQPNTPGVWPGTSAGPAATTVSDASANALFVSVALYSAGTTETLTMGAGARIQLVTA